MQSAAERSGNLQKCSEAMEKIVAGLRRGGFSCAFMLCRLLRKKQSRRVFLRAGKRHPSGNESSRCDLGTGTVLPRALGSTLGVTLCAAVAMGLRWWHVRGSWGPAGDPRMGQQC